MVAEYEEAQTNARRLLESLRRQVEQDNRRLEGDFVGSPGGDRDMYAERPSIFGRWYERPAEPERPARRREESVPTAPPPEPLSKEDLLISDECKVCFAQHCDMLLMPCAHLALCEVRVLLTSWTDLDNSGVLIGRILRLMLEGFIINVLYVGPRSRKWYVFLTSWLT
jgi:hypothetical protein